MLFLRHVSRRAFTTANATTAIQVESQFPSLPRKSTRSPVKFKKQSPDNTNEATPATSSRARRVSDMLTTTLSRAAVVLDHLVSLEVIMVLLKSLVAIPGIAQIPVAISAAWFSFFSLFSKGSRNSKVTKMEAPVRTGQKITPSPRAMAHKAKLHNQAHQKAGADSSSVEGEADTGHATTDRIRPIRILLKFVFVVAAAYVLAVRLGPQLLQYTLYIVTDIRFIAYFCILSVLFTWLRDCGLVRYPCWCYRM